MAGVGQALVIWTNISQAVSILEDLGTNSSALSKEFRAEVDVLRERVNFYDEQIRNHRGPVNSRIVAILRKAQLILTEAGPRIKSLQDMQGNMDSYGCCSLICWLYAKLRLALFPEKLELTLKKVTEEINKISSVMKQEEDFSKEMDKDRPIPRTIYTMFYDNSNLYVPIQKSHEETTMAIEDLDGPSIVLLHGGVGKGKSTLARYICAHYGGGQRRDLFELVIMVLCGGNRSRVDALSKQFEILQVLSPMSLDVSPKKEETAGLDMKVSVAHLSKDDPGAHERIEKALHTFLSNNKVLIILDDVADPKFLYDMWKVAQGCKRAKYLVTSQLGNLCDGSLENESLSIAMGDPDHNEARKILASLVGLKDKIIPQELEKEADKMIKATEGNPLALACLTSHFAKGHHKASKQTWRQALKQLDDLLARPERINVLGLNHESASVWAAMELCLNFLETTEAKDILLFMYACKGEAIPEEVLRIWYKTAKPSNLFSSSIEELSARELLKSTPSALIPTMMTWSLRPLLKLYMDGHMADEKKRMGRLFGALLVGSQVGPQSFKQNVKSGFSVSFGDNKIAQDSGSAKERVDCEIHAVESNEMRVATALCAMYFDPAHNNNIVSDMATRARNKMMDSSLDISDLRRKAIEPIIWLLDQPEEDDTWTEAHIQCVRQVFLKYVCKQQLDDEDIYMLLETTCYTPASLATVTALADILAIDEGTLLNKNHLSFLKPLLSILDSNPECVQKDHQRAACRAIVNISRTATAEDLSRIISTLPILEVLVRCLENSSADPMNEGPQGLAQNAAASLANMATRGEQISLMILSQDRALSNLVWASWKDYDPTLQEKALRALGNLACHDVESFCLPILKEKGALTGLVRSLSRHGEPNLQATAAWALANLIRNETVMDAASEDEVFPGLVMGLSQYENPLFQEHSARALYSLAAGGQPFHTRIVREDGALQSLVRALSNDNNPGFQGYAAAVLARLAGGGELIQFHILSENGALSGLVASLSKENHPVLQQQAARALQYLATGRDSCKAKILNTDEALPALVRCLSKEGNYKLQVYAARALNYLASTKDYDIKCRIRKEDRLLESLEKAMSQQNYDLRREAEKALQNLKSPIEGKG